MIWFQVTHFLGVRIVLKNLTISPYRVYKKGSEETLWQGALANCFSP